MAKVEIERGSLVGAVLIALSATLAIGLNAYSRLRVAEQKDPLTQVPSSSALSEEPAPCVASHSSSSASCQPEKESVDAR